MPGNKYLSKWSGENIDRAYEAIQHLSTEQVDKLTYVDSYGNLRATSFKKEKIGLIDITTWGSVSIPANSFLIKNSNGEIAPSNYNYFSFTGYRESGATTGPNGCLASLQVESSEGVNKYYVLNTGITTLQLTTAFSDIEDLKAAIGSGGSDLTARVATLEDTTSILTTKVVNIENQIGTSTQEGSILYRLAQIDDTLTTKANTSDVNTALAAKQNVIDSNNMLNADLVDDTTSIHKFVTASEKAQITTNANELKDTRVLRFEEPGIQYGQYFTPSHDNPYGDISHITLYHEPTIVLNELRYYYSEYKAMPEITGIDNPDYKCFVYTSELLYDQNGFYYKNMLVVDRTRNRIYYELYFGDSTAIPTNNIVEFKSRKVTSLSASSTDLQYPSAKCVYDYISGTDDGTNWTSLTIGNTTKAIPSGGGGGTSVSGTNDGTNWTTITISGSTYNIPNNGSVTISQVQVNDPAKVPSSALMYSVNSRVVELETQLAAALQEINSLKQRVSAIEEDYVVATDDHTEVEVSGNDIKFISDVNVSGNEIDFTKSFTHLSGDEILL